MPTAVPVVVLRHDPLLSVENTWRLALTFQGVEALVTIGGIRYFVEAKLRWRRPVPNATHVAPKDAVESLWVTQALSVAAGVVVAFQLERAPRHTADIMMGW